MMIFCAIRDIRERTFHEKKIREQQRKLAYFSHGIVASETASGLSHELNQPLTSIVQYLGGCLERLKEYSLPEDITKTLNDVMAQAERAGEIVHSMKNFLSKGELNKTRVNLNDLIRETLDIAENLISDSKVSVKLSLDKQLPETLLDKSHFQQIIINLISNALEAMGEDENRELIIKTSKHVPDKIKLNIIDSGKGIPKHLIEKIFDPFYTTKDDGMGVGLSLSRSVLEAHGAFISVDSTVGKGSDFCVVVPLVENEVSHGD